jgi:hypothetical protein
VAEALLTGLELPDAVLSEATDASVPMPVAVAVAVSGCSCILGTYQLPMQVLWEEDSRILPQRPSGNAHKNSAPGLLR